MNMTQTISTGTRNKTPRRSATRSRPSSGMRTLTQSQPVARGDGEHEAPATTGWGRLAQAAERGDLNSILAILKEDPTTAPSMRGWDDVTELLSHCLAKLASRGGETLAEALLAQTLVKYGEFYLRCSLTIDALIGQHDQANSGPLNFGGLLPPEVTEKWLPRMSKIEGEMRNVARLMIALRKRDSPAGTAAQGQRESPRDGTPTPVMEGATAA